MAPAALQVWLAAIKAVNDLETAELAPKFFAYPGLYVKPNFIKATQDLYTLSLKQQSAATWGKLVDSKVRPLLVVALLSHVPRELRQCDTVFGSCEMGPFRKLSHEIFHGNQGRGSSRWVSVY